MSVRVHDIIYSLKYDVIGKIFVILRPSTVCIDKPKMQIPSNEKTNENFALSTNILRIHSFSCFDTYKCFITVKVSFERILPQLVYPIRKYDWIGIH